MTRVVITGLGVVSSVGQSTPDYWGSLIAGRSTFAPPTLGTAGQATGKLVGEVKGFEPVAHFDSSQLPLLGYAGTRKLDRLLLHEARHGGEAISWLETARTAESSSPT